MKFPTQEQIEEADKDQLKNWWLELQSTSLEQRRIMILIEKRLLEMRVLSWRYMAGGN